MFKALILLAVVLGCVHAAEYDYITVNGPRMWSEFKSTFGRTYSTAADEHMRYQYFLTNMRLAAKIQAANPLATFGMNKFSDMSAAEFKRHHNAEKLYARLMQVVRPTARFTEQHVAATLAANASVDWRKQGAVTGVKDQGDCGSCWSFSTTGNIEGQWYLKNGSLTSVSEQELVSCDTNDDGCDGGLMDNAFKWLISEKSGSIVTEASYPYVSGQGDVPDCSMSNTVVGATIKSYIDITKNENQMATWVANNGPMSIAVDANTWQSYTGGIVTDCENYQIDHGVLLVGYDLTGATPYWIIKNSWGASWGEAGYIRVKKGSNECLITSYPCSAKV